MSIYSMESGKERIMTTQNHSKEFLWVNKDSNSTCLLRSSPSELLKIQRFIQSNASHMQQRKRKAYWETTHTFSVTPGERPTEAPRSMNSGPDLEAFNCRLSRWRLISPSPSTPGRRTKDSKLLDNQSPASSSPSSPIDRSISPESPYQRLSQALEQRLGRFCLHMADFHICGYCCKSSEGLH